MKIKNDFVLYNKLNAYNTTLFKINTDVVTENDILDVEQNLNNYFDYISYNTNTLIYPMLYFNFNNISNIIVCGDEQSKTFYVRLIITDISECSKQHFVYIVRTDFNQLMRGFKLHQLKKLVL